MSKRLFREGGPLRIRHTGSDRYQLNIPLAKDAEGRLARECTQSGCSPGYFKVKLGTGITGEQTLAYCPYCRASDSPEKFTTQGQVDYAKSMVMREVHQGAQRMIQDAFGLGSSRQRTLSSGLVSMKLSYKPGSLPPMRYPFEDEVRRDVICPHCGLDQTVFGLATWCADCGTDIFMTHVQAEIAVVRAMAGDVPRRAESFGKRVGAKDLENCLEDTVSIFEAAMKAIFRQGLKNRGKAPEEIETVLKKVGNAFQNIDRTQKEIVDVFAIEVGSSVPWSQLRTPFEKRHPITHNLGVVDRKYLDRVSQAEREGREVRIRPDEIEALLTNVVAGLDAIRTGILANAQAANTSCS